MDGRTTITVTCPKPPLPIVWAVAGFLGGIVLGVIMLAEAYGDMKRDVVKAGVICVDATCYRVSAEAIGAKP